VGVVALVNPAGVIHTSVPGFRLFEFPSLSLFDLVMLTA
jgi:hypothetical protein